MRRPLVIGNWKMNGSRAGAREFFDAILSTVNRFDRTDIGVCVPFVFIPEAAQQLADNPRVQLGAQTVSDHQGGAFTGEVSAKMLTEFGCRLAIVGHSERRMLYGESNEQVAGRCEQALAAGIQPIFCVGETLEQRQDAATFQVIAEQLEALFDRLAGKSLDHLIVAYEPVWAIGSGKTATVDEVQEVHDFIRAVFSDTDRQLADNLHILYGGSINPENAADFFAMADIDGVLIGSASLDPQLFLSICEAANSIG